MKWLILAALIVVVTACADIKGGTPAAPGEANSGGGGSGTQNEGRYGGYMY